MAKKKFNRKARSLRQEMEQHLQAKVITYDNAGKQCAGGMCRCCGCGPNTEPDYQADPGYIYAANLCDADGVFYSMLCEACLEELRHQNSLRKDTERDMLAKEICDLLGDDLDGAQSIMDDLRGFDLE